MRNIVVVSVLAVLAMVAPALGAESVNAKIQGALSAAPDSIKAGAAVIDVDEHGKQTLLRRGTNGFTCFPGHPGVVGDDPICADHQTMIWLNDWNLHRPKPTNT